MALWLVRTGRHGEHESKFLKDNRIYLTWGHFKHNLERLNDRSALKKLLSDRNPNASKGKISNHASQIWAFATQIAVGDWVVVPSKQKPVINIAEVTGAYVFTEEAEDPYFHHFDVKWVGMDIPRSSFNQDLLYSFGAFMTICRIERNDAEKRIRAMAGNGWKPEGAAVVVSEPSPETEDTAEVDEAIDLERLAKDAIAKLIIRNFKGHGMARLVDAVLRAQGYTTHLSPPGPDKGVDLLAAPGPLGFGHPRICVQVKSGDSPVDHPTLSQLVGAMQHVRADQGLLVSWGGFKSSIEKDRASQFFSVRLWDQDDLIGQILEHYDSVDEDLRAELPLKRIWAIASQEETDEG